MAATQLARFTYADRMGNDFHLMDHISRITGHTFVLFTRNQPLLKPLVVGRDAGGASILVTLKSLDAAQAEHEPARRRDEISARCQRPSDITRIDQLATCDNSDATA